MLGSQTFEAICQTTSRTASRMKFGSAISARNNRRRRQPPRDAATRGAGCDGAPASLSVGEGCATTAPSGLEGLAIKGPGPGQVTLFRPRLRLLQRGGVGVSRIGKRADLARPALGNERRLRRNDPAEFLVSLVHETGIERIRVILGAQLPGQP